MMILIDELTRNCLAMRMARRINATGTIKTQVDATLFEGVATLPRSDTGTSLTTNECHIRRQIPPASASYHHTDVRTRRTPKHAIVSGLVLNITQTMKSEL